MIASGSATPTSVSSGYAADVSAATTTIQDTKVFRDGILLESGAYVDVWS